MGTIVGVLKMAAGFFLGKSENLGVANRVAGAANYAWALPAIGWLWWHRAENLTLNLVLDHGGHPETISLFTASYLGASLVVGAIFAWIEFGRRAP